MPVSVGELLAYLRLDSSGFDRGIRVAQEEMTSAAGSADRMSGAVTSSSQALAGAGRSAGLATRGTAAFRAAQLSAVAATERYNAVLAQGDASLGRLAAAEAAVIRANQRVIATSPAASMRETNVAAMATPGLMERSASGFLKAGRAALGLGALFGAFELVKKSIDITKEANDFQRAMVQVQTNADVSAVEVNKASAALLAMAGPVAAAPAELATAWYHAKSVGLDYAKSIETTRIAAEGARVGHADLEETMNALTSTVASGIPGVKDMSSAMGQLIAVVGSGDMKLSDLNEALGTGILVRMKQYGLSLTDVGAALATFGDNNIRGADAATLLRMSVEAMAKQGAPGQAALERIGIKANQLRDDLQKGGLNKAVLDLNAHLKTAGITGDRVGGFLIDAFTKKGGGGVSVLLGQLDRLQSKFHILHDSGASFGDKWKATTGTASFALARLGHGLEALGISLTAKLGPSVASAAQWLGTTIPHAAEVLSSIIGPTAHLVGEGLGGAFHLLGAILGPVASALGTVGNFLSENRAVVTGLAVTVLSLWSAFKLVALASAGLRLIGPALTRIGMAASSARTNMASFATAGRGGALAVAGGLGLLAIGWQQSSQIAAQEAAKQKAIWDSLGAAIDEDKGKLGEHTQKVIFDTLAQNNASTIAGKYGLSMEQLSSAVKGNAGMFDKARAAGMKYAMDTFDIGGAADYLLSINDLSDGLKKQLKDYQVTTDAAHAHQTALDGGTVAAHAAADALGATQTAYLDAQTAAASNTSQTTAQTLAFQLENDAASLLQQALDRLAGINLNVATAQTALASANLSVAASFKQNGDAITGGTKKAVANQQAIQGQIQAAQQLASAIGKKTHSTKAEVQSLKDSKAALEGQLAAQHKLTPAVQAYIDKLYDIKAVSDYLTKHPTQHDVKVKVDPKPVETAAQKIQARINAIRQNKVPGLAANSANARMIIAELQAEIDRLHGKSVSIDVATTFHNIGRASAGGPKAFAKGTGTGGLPEGWSTVGEQGGNPSSWELLHKRGSHVDVFSNRDSRKMLGRDHVPGFASGTTAGAVDHYGPAFMRALDGMTLKMSAASTSGSANRPAPQSVADGTRQYIRIDKFEQNVSNPVPEPLSVSGPANLRRAALALGR